MATLQSSQPHASALPVRIGWGAAWSGGAARTVSDKKWFLDGSLPRSLLLAITDNVANKGDAKRAVVQHLNCFVTDPRDSGYCSLSLAGQESKTSSATSKFNKFTTDVLFIREYMYTWALMPPKQLGVGVKQFSENTLHRALTLWRIVKRPSCESFSPSSTIMQRCWLSSWATQKQPTRCIFYASTKWLLSKLIEQKLYCPPSSCLRGTRCLLAPSALQLAHRAVWCTVVVHNQ